MNPTDELSLSVKRQIDRLCDEFEIGWKSNQRLRVEDCLNRVSNGQSHLFYELVKLEVELTRADGGEVDKSDFFERFPQHREILADVFKVNTGQDVPGSSQMATGHQPSSPQPTTTELGGGDKIGKFIVRRTLGKGSFGIVYLARHPLLGIDVAIKVPLPHRFHNPTDIKNFIQDARHAASLKHPGIVTIHDIDQHDDFPFIVQEYLSGGDLKESIRARAYSPDKTAEMIATVADAVAFSHKNGVYHRDLKPGNILLDGSGQPRVADFGLAIRERSRRSHQGEVCGTPAYMSPEQIRGEAHRIDGRCDIWSLGIIMYEMLVERRPFSGESRGDLFGEVLEMEPVPPRQINPAVPAELERICLKCLSKRIAERYATASDLAEELRCWTKAQQMGQGQGTEQLPRNPVVVPKGLRSFEVGDKDFFLDLLPGPRDRDNLPEIIRFWKSKIEETDPEQTFSVGLIYGPSGCGKTSLVKAGLLPQLASNVVSLYIESTAGETGVRLLKGLRKRFPEMPRDLSLPEAFAMLRDGDWLDRNRKLLIVFDQFEQWLHANRGQSASQLVDALRHCDGGRIQSLILVHTDFWHATSEFMRNIEIELVQNRNSTLIDLFEPVHARKVLAEFGRAFGRLDAQGITKQQNTFLDQAIEALAVDGKVVCVRLALFAEMFKDRTWDPVVLKKIGGAEGVGVTFLNETFVNESAPREHRLHKVATQACLNALLPKDGSDNLKGHMLPRQELLLASGYQNRPEKFESMLQVLDDELRLITPTDPEGREGMASEASDRPAGSYYQLTHDYLVSPVRKWIRRENEKSYSGRNLIRLAERADVWNSHNRHRKYLPSWWEFVRFRLFSNAAQWSESQQKMMSAATGYHGLFTAVATMIVFMISWFSYLAYGYNQATSILGELQRCTTTEVPEIVRKLENFRKWANPLLHDALLSLSKSQPADSLAQEAIQRQQLHISMGLLASDPKQLPVIKNGIYSVPFDHVRVLAEFPDLIPYKPEIERELIERLLSNADDRSDRATRESTVLAYWGQPRFLVNVLLDADPKDFPQLLPPLKSNVEDSIDYLRSVFDPVENKNRWPNPPNDLVERLKPYSGIVHSAGALVQTLPLNETDDIMELMFQSGYTPTSFRPYQTPSQTKVAIAWTRKKPEAIPIGDVFQVRHGLSAGELAETDLEMQKAGLKIFDVSFYDQSRSDPSVGSYHAALWRRPDDSTDVKLFVGINHETFNKQWEDNLARNYQLQRLFVHSEPDGQPLFSGIWASEGHGSNADETPPLPQIDFKSYFGDFWPGAHQTDCQFTAIDLAKKDFFNYQLEAFKKLKESPESGTGTDLEQIAAGGDKLKAMANYHRIIGNTDEAIRLYTQLIESLKDKEELNLLRRDRAIAFFDAGDAKALRDEIDQSTAGRASLALLRVRYAVLQNNADMALEQISVINEVLAANPKKRKDRMDLNIMLARAKSLAARIQTQSDPRVAASLRAESITALTEVSRDGEIRFVLHDRDFDSLRNEPMYHELMAKLGLDYRYMAAWSNGRDWETRAAFHLDLSNHESSAKKSLDEGFIPRCVSVRYSANTDVEVASSVWERELDSPSTKNTRDRRRANAAMALAHLGFVENLFQSMGDTYGSATRNHVVYRLPSTRFDPQKLLQRVLDCDSSVDARSLLLTLGGYDLADLNFDDNDLFRAKLVDATAESINDPGVKSALDWCLRSWGLETTDHGQLRDFDGKQYWYANEIGQTMIVLKPAEVVLIGSPFAELDRGKSEPQHWVRIPRTFSVSSTETSVAQFRQFLNDPDVKRLYVNSPFEYTTRHAPDDDCPQISVRWIDAIRFCNWLSKIHGIPEDQWCYPGIDKLSQDHDYSPPADALLRSGYRLLTEDEWEFAARSSCLDARSFGDSEELLDLSSWCLRNSNDRSHPVRMFRPNDFGLHDTLGNVSEWCHNKWKTYLPPSDSWVHPDTGALETEYDGLKRIVRGGHFRSSNRELRSADRNTADPSQKSISVGFRVARTVPPGGTQSSAKNE